jgi:DNA primase
MAQPGDFAYTVKTSVDIVRVIGEYVRLKRASGTSYKGLCPFHQEKTPSFSVSGQFQFYNCFGCGAKGDVFKFVMEMDRLTFPEAVRVVAEKNGIPIPKMRSPENDPQARLRAQIFELHERAAVLFREQLEAAEGAPARQYLNKRGLSPEMVREFGLGYAPANGQALVKLFGTSVPEEALEQSGLVRKRDDRPGWFDTFRNRLIFPIQNEAGKVIAFGGRALRDEDQPKYLNSRETPIYRKSRVLYNAHRARDVMRRLAHVVLVEGYMDAIGVFSAGVPNVVASCGTALTLEHVKQLAPMVKTVTVNFDPDSAGVDATEKSLSILLEEKLDVRVLALPGNHDPDEFVKANGAAAYRELLEHAPQFFDYLVARVPSMFDLTRPDGKAAAARHLLGYVTKLPDRIVRVEMAGRLADRLNLDRDLLGKEMRTAAAERRYDPAMGKAATSKLSQTEKTLVRLLVLDAEARKLYLQPLAKLLDSTPALAQLHIRPIIAALAAMSLDDPSAAIDVPALADRLLEPEQQMLAHTLHDEEVEAITADKAITYIEDLARKPLEARVEELRGFARIAAESGDTAKAVRLLEEKKAIERQLGKHYLLDNAAQR